MNYSGLYHADCLNGTGFRVVLFVSGCSHGCKGCQNPQTHNPKFGDNYTSGTVTTILNSLDKPHIAGLTISGGDPLFKRNFDEVLKLARTVKHNLPDKTIWLYSGYTFEQVTKDIVLSQILDYVDVMVDGKFEQSLLDKTLKFRGSSNQLLVDVKQSIAQQDVVLYSE